MSGRNTRTDEARAIEEAARRSLGGIATGTGRASATLDALGSVVGVTWPARNKETGRAVAAPAFLATATGPVRLNIGRGPDMFDLVLGGIPADVKASGDEVRLTANVPLGMAVRAARFDYPIVQVAADTRDTGGNVWEVSRMKFRVASGLQALDRAVAVPHRRSATGTRLRVWARDLDWSPSMTAAGCLAFIGANFTPVKVAKVETARIEVATGNGWTVRVHPSGRVTVRRSDESPHVARAGSILATDAVQDVAEALASGAPVRVCRVQVSNLRKILESARPGAGEAILTVRGQGHMFA